MRTHRFPAPAGAKAVSGLALLALAGVAASASAAAPTGSESAPAALASAPAPGWSGADALELRVAERLAASGTLAGARIDVDVDDAGVATLRGVVSGAEQAERARRLAASTEGIERVETRFERNPDAVEARRGREVSDERIARELAEQLAAELGGDPVPSSFRRWQVSGEGWTFVVDADEGSVCLEGTVPEPDALVHALRIARRAPGVRDVRSRLALPEDHPLYRAPAHGPRAYGPRPYATVP